MKRRRIGAPAAIDRGKRLPAKFFAPMLPPNAWQPVLRFDIFPAVGKYAKLITAILLGRSDANIGFDELRGLLLKLGFEERTRGSHHVFRRDGIEERINLQRDGSNAKPYQVRQVRAVLVRHNLETGE